MTVKATNSFFKELLGSSDFVINGKTINNYIWSAEYGKMDCSNLISQNVLVINHGTNNCYVRASNSVDARVYYSGNIYYYGKPNNFSTTDDGKGKIINLPF